MGKKLLSDAVNATDLNKRVMYTQGSQQYHAAYVLRAKSSDNKDDGEQSVEDAVSTVVDAVDESDSDSSIDTRENRNKDVVAQFRDQWCDESSDALKSMTPYEFEQFGQALVAAMGVKFVASDGDKKTRDGGIDGLGYVITDDFRTQKIVIQCKRWDHAVPGPEIDKFRGVIQKKGADYGIFITNNYFNSGAVVNARGEYGRPVTLIDFKKLADLVAKYQLHVKPVTTYVLDDFYPIPDVSEEDDGE